MFNSLEKIIAVLVINYINNTYNRLGSKAAIDEKYLKLAEICYVPQNKKYIFRPSIKNSSNY